MWHRWVMRYGLAIELLWTFYNHCNIWGSPVLGLPHFYFCCFFPKFGVQFLLYEDSYQNYLPQRSTNP